MTQNNKTSSTTLGDTRGTKENPALKVARLSAHLKAAFDGQFKPLLDKRVVSPAHATREMDGRLVPIVLVTVRDELRRPVAGVTLELRGADDKVIDSTRSSPGGLAVLRFPARKPRPSRNAKEQERVTVLADGGDVSGTVALLDGSFEPPTQKVTIPPSLQAAKLVFVISELRDLSVQLPPGDDPLTRLPIDFSEATCDLLINRRNEDGLLDIDDLRTRADPLFSPPAGVKTIAGKRMPLIRRFDVVRFGEDNKRFLVRLRQEWVLLAYTLGELADVTALDPGAVLQSADQILSETSSFARDVVKSSTRRLTRTLQDSLSQLGTVDSVISTVTNASASTSASAGGAGLFIGVPGLGFGIGGGFVDTSASSHLDLTVNTNVNTSLLVNRAIQQASTLVNEAVAKTREAAERIQQSVTDVTNHLAPLVTQVANALHWRVYEVYAVCTNVDAVHPITELPLFVETTTDLLDPFTADDVRAYRSFFEPALLDPTLADGFDALTETAELPPLNEATVEVTCDSNFRFTFFSVNAVVSMTINGITATATVARGNSRQATLRFNFTTPVPRGGTTTATFTITPSLPGASGTGVVRRAEVWIDRPLDGPGFIVNNPSSPFQVPIAGGPGKGDVLLSHINRHIHYYYGVLAAAAIVVPSLRQDAPQLAGLDSRLWRLPLIGLEGTVALLIDDPDPSVDAATLLDDPGSGTLVQILAPGSYGEILTGLLEIPLDLIHPLLKEVGTVSPFGPFPTLPSDTPTTAITSVLPVP